MEKRNNYIAEELEAHLEALHRTARMDREEETEKLRRRLEGAGRRISYRRPLWRWAGIAAAVAVAAAGGWWLRGIQAEEVFAPQIARTEPAPVPVLLREEHAGGVAVRTLDLGKEDLTYDVAEEFAGDMEAEEAVPVTFEKAVIPAGYTYTVALADGSKVILNAGSELRFPSRFGDTSRVVELKGEAYFEVAKSTVPFVVRAGEARVRVYGTRFNLLCSEELGLTEAVLVEGSIGMTVGEEEVRIVPNQRVFVAEDATLQVETVRAEEYIAWTDDSFKYHGMSLERIVYDIDRWYGIRIEMPSEWRERIFYMEFDKSSTLERTLQILGIVIGGEITKKEGNIYAIE